MKIKPNPVLEKLAPELERTLDSFGYELVQAKLGGRPGSQTLTILMDKPGGVTAGDCRYMASRLSVLLDALDPIQGHYTLVVSSPGVNRPLTRDTDFERFAGENVAIRWAPPDAGPRTVRGRLTGLRDGSVWIEVDGKETAVPLEAVETANIVYDWERGHDQDEQGAGLSDERRVP